jgi:hypothetical protein
VRPERSLWMEGVGGGSAGFGGSRHRRRLLLV